MLTISNTILFSKFLSLLAHKWSRSRQLINFNYIIKTSKEPVPAALIRGALPSQTPMPSGELFASVLSSVTHLQLCRGDWGVIHNYVLNAHLCPSVIQISEEWIVSLVVQPTILRLQIEDQDSL